jgi:hypothetical protein
MLEQIRVGAPERTPLWRRRKRARCQRGRLVEPLQLDMLRLGVDLLALNLRFATSNQVASANRGLPPYFNNDRDILRMQLTKTSDSLR